MQRADDRFEKGVTTTNTQPLVRRVASPAGAAAQAGTEAETFARLYQEHTPAVLNYCRYRVGNEAAAEDLTADTFERAWRARRRYDPHRAEFGTWLMAIARRAVTDWLRRQHRRPTAALHDESASPLPGPDVLAAEAQDQQHLRRLVAGLPDRDREMLALKFGAGMTNRQIARVLHKSESAVGSAVYRIVHRLRLHWEEPR